MNEIIYEYSENVRKTQGEVIILTRTLKSRIRRRRADVDMIESGGGGKQMKWVAKACVYVASWISGFANTVRSEEKERRGKERKPDRSLIR